MTKYLGFIALATAALAACEQNRGVTSPAAAVATSLQAQRGNQSGEGGDGPRAVYTLTNQVAGNAVAVFNRSADGTLTAAGTIATGGTGTGAGLGSQGAVALSDDGRRLFAVNAGSNDVSVFDVGPAQVSFSPDGRRLVVTEKNTSLLDVYAVDANGAAGARTSFTSAGGTPFGFAFGPRQVLLVSEAAAPGSASSYVVGQAGDLRVASGSVLTHQGAPCWAVVTNDGRFGFTGNGSGSVSGFSIAADGSISLIDPNGASALIGAGVNDIALSSNSRYLYVLQTGGAQAIHAFRIERDGHLAPLGPVGGLPAGTRGLAAF